MRVTTVGGGPAGLFASMLLKLGDPSAQVDVHEARPRGQTFGFGVVFSDATLAALRDADAPAHAAITDRFVRWTAIEVVHRSERVRSDGHAFAGLGRAALLELLERRCEEVGVAVHHEAEVVDLPALTAGADLVLGADGVRSAVRAAGADTFGPSLEEGLSRYIWFGTDLLLDAFTFLFRESPHGWFQAHAYPYDGEAATFIVETDAATWQRAGLNQASEPDSIAFCEALFAEDLRGAKLIGNQSRWLTFATLRTRRWSAGSTVLLGDAAHTAHFSIGSGTKLALEDAAALAQAVAVQPDLPAALRRYELQRKPVVERFQAAAHDSRRFFEGVGRRTHLSPRQLAFLLLTRSGRVTYDSLRVRDARYAGGVDRWFAGQEQRLVAPPPVLTPVTVGESVVPNRIAVAPVFAAPAVAEGMVSPAWSDELAGAAASGAGLVLAGPLAVEPRGRTTPEDPGLWADDHVGPLASAIAAARAGGATGALIGLRLGHAGPRASTRPRREGLDRPLRTGGWQVVGATATPFTPASAVPVPLDAEGRGAVVSAYAAAATRAAASGADLVQVDLADGGLLSSFLSQLANPHDDSRDAFPLAVVDAVRAALPAAMPLAVRMTADELAVGGATIADAVALARTLGGRGVALVEVRLGQTSLRAKPSDLPGPLLEAADALRHDAGVAVVAVVADVGEANTALAGGRLDLALLPRLSAAPQAHR